MPADTTMSGFYQEASDVFTVLSDQQLRQEMANGAVLLASHTQAVRAWQYRFLDPKCHRPQSTVRVESWQQCLLKAAADAALIPLNPIQERAVWQQALKDCGVEHRLISALSKQAMRAYGLLRQAALSLHDLQDERYLGNEESHAFYQWSKSMLKHVQAMQGCRILLADVVGRLLNEELESQTVYILDQGLALNQMQYRFLKHVQQAGAQIFCAPMKKPDHLQCRFIKASTVDDEYKTVLQSVLEHHQAQPQQRLLIVSDDADMRARLMRGLSEHLLPHEQAMMGFTAVQSMGHRLMSYPMIHQAVSCLQMASRPVLSEQQFGLLLCSPYLIGDHEERQARYRFLWRCRQQNRHEYSFKSLLASDLVKKEMPQWRNLVLSLYTKIKAQCLPSVWAATARELLQSLGFLADHVTLNDVELAQMNALHDVMMTVASLDELEAAVSWSRFMSFVSEQCQSKTLMLTATNPQIQVLSMQQAVSLQADKVWVLGMDAQSFPRSESPNPLLPMALQKAYGFPAVHAEQQLKQAKRLWQQMQSIADSMVLSFSSVKDEAQLTAAFVVQDLPVQECQPISLEVPVLEQQPYNDDEPFPPLAQESLSAKVAVLEDQAACPFRAFARHRLGLQQPNDLREGLTASQKGSLLHRILDYLWADWRDQSGLLAMLQKSPESWQQRWSAVFARAWQDEKIYAADWQRRVEKKRLKIVLDAWLLIEQQRPAFSVVMREQEVSWTAVCSGDKRIALKLRLDRVDEEQGHLFVFDYKSGRLPTLPKENEDRLLKPQLPLYALALQENAEKSIAGVAYAGLLRGEMSIKGLCQKNAVWSDQKKLWKWQTSDDWSALLERWQQQCQDLLEEYMCGRSDVQPMAVDACRYCELKAVCRIHEKES